MPVKTHRDGAGCGGFPAANLADALGADALGADALGADALGADAQGGRCTGGPMHRGPMHRGADAQGDDEMCAKAEVPTPVPRASLRPTTRETGDQGGNDA
jgi:hypothetical protein